VTAAHDPRRGRLIVLAGPSGVGKSSVVAGLRAALPELPLARAERFERDLGLSADSAHLLAFRTELGDYFEAAVDGDGANAQPVANWLANELLSRLEVARLVVAPEQDLVVDPRHQPGGPFVSSTQEPPLRCSTCTWSATVSSTRRSPSSSPSRSRSARRRTST